MRKEKRYLIEMPFSWYGKFKAHTAEKTKIYQTFLMEPDVKRSWVRANTIWDKPYGSLKYTYWTINDAGKEFVVPLTNEEYRGKLNFCDPTRDRIYKSRHILLFNDKEFTLDLYEHNLVGVTILKTVVDDTNVDILTPPQFKIRREITGNSAFYAEALAIKEWVGNKSKTVNI